jgi:hypothetical protein
MIFFNETFTNFQLEESDSDAYNGFSSFFIEEAFTLFWKKEFNPPDFYNRF